VTRRGVVELLAIAFIVAIAAFLRFDHLGEASYWLDEILHQQLTTKFAAQPWWRWIVALHDEHGTLYYLSQWATRAFGTSEAAGRSAAAFFGVATIPMVWFASRSTRAAAILLAVSPLHVYFSREARAYALLMFLTAALIVVLLRARSLVALCAVLAAMLYTAAVAAPVVASALLVSIVCALQTRNRWFWRAAIACGVTVVLFRVIYAAKPVADPAWPGFPAVTLDLAATLMRTFTVSALGTATGTWGLIAILALLAFAGALAMARRSATEAIVVIGMTVLPLGAAIASLKAFDHFFAGRYVTPAVIGFLMLAGAGISALVRFDWLAALVAGVLAWQTWATARTEPFQKLDWRQIATVIWTHARPGELVIAAQPWSEVSLRYYLSKLPPRVELVHIFAPEVVDVQRQIHDGVWLVSAGFTADPRVRDFICRYPLVLASPLEEFRLHYASRAIDGDARLFFGEGWASPEGAFRWSVSKRATVVIPRWDAHDERIRVRVLPMAHASLPPQTLALVLNGHRLGQVTLPNGWSDQSFDAPARFWVQGANTLAFESGHAVAPASLDPKATDQRTLAVSFQSIEAGGPFARVTALIDEETAWRGTKTRFAADRLRREAVIPLIERLGFNPDLVWPKLARGEVRLDDLVESAAWGSDCKDERQFLDSAFEALLERKPLPQEARELSALPDVRAAGRIAKWDEFRGRMLLPKPAAP
jgi:hypothetical protein